MANIVYLFGAGASIGALPIVNQIPTKLHNFINILQLREFELSISDLCQDGKTTYSSAKQILLDDLIWLLNESSAHASVDTFAKKLFLTHRDSDLIRLKLSLSVFFIYEQLKNKPDNRYDVFFASILSSEIDNLPSNIRIISWNYDYQFEMAYHQFSRNNSLKSNQSLLNVIAKYNQEDRQAHDRFTIYKLNGATNIRSADNKNAILFLNDLKTTFDAAFLLSVLDKYIPARVRKDDSACTVSFAWEGYNDHPDAFLNSVATRLKDTEVLTVIGYSFPFFNRTIDRKIIGSMEKLKKVYIQSPEAENVQERLEGVIPENRKINFILKKDVAQFFMPNEL